MRNLKVLFGLLFTFSTPTVAIAQAAAKETNATFGRFSDCTAGRGVCAFNVQRIVVNGSTTKSAEKTSGNTFILKVRRSDLTVADEIRIAGKAFSQIASDEKIVFQQAETITLDKNTVANLGFQPALNKIPAGNYPMVILNDVVEVTFTITP